MHAHTCRVQRGKVGGARFEPLPDAPKKEELVDRVPKSLQRMLNLKVGASGGKGGASSTSQCGGGEPTRAAPGRRAPTNGMFCSVTPPGE